MNTRRMSAGRWLSKHAVQLYAVLAFAYLFIPVAYTFIYSFNDSGKSNLNWQGFTTDKWANPCGAPDVCNALENSIKIAVVATVVATALGTMAAFALARHRFRPQWTTPWPASPGCT